MSDMTDILNHKTGITISLAIAITGGVLSFTVWSTTKLSQIDSLKSEVSSLEGTVSNLSIQIEKVKSEGQENDKQVIDRLARFETKLDLLLDQSKKN